MITQQGLEISSQNLRHPSACDFNIEKTINVTWLEIGHRLRTYLIAGYVRPTQLQGQLLQRKPPQDGSSGESLKSLFTELDAIFPILCRVGR